MAKTQRARAAAAVPPGASPPARGDGREMPHAERGVRPRRRRGRGRAGPPSCARVERRRATPFVAHEVEGPICARTAAPRRVSPCRYTAPRASAGRPPLRRRWRLRLPLPPSPPPPSAPAHPPRPLDASARRRVARRTPRLLVAHLAPGERRARSLAPTARRGAQRLGATSRLFFGVGFSPERASALGRDDARPEALRASVDAMSASGPRARRSARPFRLLPPASSAVKEPPKATRARQPSARSNASARAGARPQLGASASSVGQREAIASTSKAAPVADWLGRRAGEPRRLGRRPARARRRPRRDRARRAAVRPRPSGARAESRRVRPRRAGGTRPWLSTALARSTKATAPRGRPRCSRAGFAAAAAGFRGRLAGAAGRPRRRMRM